jgi:hypothetical protein
MKKPLLWVIILIVLLGLYATNPTKTEFKEYAKEQIKQEVQNSGAATKSFMDSILLMISGYVAEKAVDTVVTRDNYYLFSIYSVKGKESKYKFLGIFRSFIPVNLAHE